MLKIVLLLSMLIGAAQAEINIVTDRSDFHLKEIAKQYQKKYNEKVRVFHTKKGLLQRAKLEKYDIIITKNSSVIVAAKKMELLTVLPTNIYHDLDVNFKDRDFTWFNMSYRIRAFYVKKGFKNPPLTYKDLAKPEYKGKICIRKHTHNYNLELYGHLLDRYGKEEFTKWFKAFKSNLARKPVGNDRNQVKGIYDGECEIAVANTYYMGLMMNDSVQKKWAASVDLIIPNQNLDFDNNVYPDDYPFREGAAIALFSGVGVKPNYSKNTPRFLKFILSDPIQKSLSTVNFEYPLDAKNIGKTASQFGKFQGLKFKDIKLGFSKQDELYDLRKEVYKIIKSN